MDGYAPLKETVETPSNVLSILIFSYNRPLYLKRAIAYWGLSNYQVMIADGSTSPLELSFPANVEYLHRPGASLGARIRELSKRTNTPYVIVVPDDDFLAFHGIRAAARFLDRNPEYSSVQGWYIRFGYDPGQHLASWFWDYRYARNYVFADADYRERLRTALQSPVMHYCYSLMRKLDLERVLQLMDGVEEMSASTFELSFLIGLMSSGKHATLPVFYGARQAQEQKWDTHLKFSDWVENNAVSGYLKWRENISKLWCSLHGLSEESALGLVDDFVASYRSSQKPKCRVANEADSAASTSSWKSCIPEHSKRKLRVLRHQFGNCSMVLHMFEKNRIGTMDFWKDWGTIKSSILDHRVE